MLKIVCGFEQWFIDRLYRFSVFQSTVHSNLMYKPQIPKKQELKILYFFEHPRKMSFSKKNIFRDFKP